MADKPRYTAAQVIAALKETKGMVFLAAKRLGCDPDTVQNYCKRHPSVMAAKLAERGEMVDTSELKLWQAIQNGEAWAITLSLKTIGKDRGYVERSEVTGKEGGPVEHRIYGNLGDDYSVSLPAPPAAPEDALPEHGTL